MPVLIDGNNLLFAARSAGTPDKPPGRSALCALLGRWARRRAEAVHVVFDGPPPAPGLASQIADPALTVTYSGAGVSADDVIAHLLVTDSAARRLLVVSSDRAVAKAARARRARPIDAGAFWNAVCADLSRPVRPRLEPPEKRRGLEPDRVDEWMREMGFGETSD